MKYIQFNTVETCQNSYYVALNQRTLNYLTESLIELLGIEYRPLTDEDVINIFMNGTNAQIEPPLPTNILNEFRSLLDNEIWQCGECDPGDSQTDSFERVVDETEQINNGARWHGRLLCI